MTDPVLVLAGLVLAHLVADFVLQTERMVADKSASGRRVWRGLGLHGLGVAVCLVPFVVVFGTPGLWVLAIVSLSHVAIDRIKVLATRRAEARALAAAHARHVPAAGGPLALGAAWTPVPAALFVLDQLAHGAILAGAALWLAMGQPLDAVAGATDRVVAGLGWDHAVFHRAVLALVTGVALVIVNVRAGALFVTTLVHPRAVVSGLDEAGSPDAGPLGPAEPKPPSAWRVRAGPLEAVVEPVAPAAERPAAGATAAGDATAMAERTAPAGGSQGAGDPRRHASPAQVGATIGVLERLLIVTFVLTNAQAAIGFVVAAKTLARFKQLDDRDFAEYYLLGTLASVAVALTSGLVAAAALRTAGIGV